MSFYIRGKKRKLELAELRFIRSGKHIEVEHRKIMAVIEKEQNAAQQKLNKDIRLLNREQRRLRPKIKARVRVYSSLEKIENRRREILLTIERSTSPEAKDFSSDKLLVKQRSATVSHPINHNTDSMKESGSRMSSRLRQPLAIDITMDKELVAALTMKKLLPGLTSDDYNSDDIISDDGIPTAVLNRGRRMSRSATCMNDLVRQELSDYIDNKKEHLPTLSNPDIGGKGKLSYNLEPAPTRVGQKPLLATKSFEEPSALKTSQRLSPELPSRSVSPCPSDNDKRSRTSSLPSPPTIPKPPTSARLHRHLVRRPRSAVKVVGS